jgi:hypothetical protein
VLDQEVGLAKEVKRQEENGIVNMKSRGLGDSIHKFTTATGIKAMVDKVSQGLNIPCGCEGRRQALNNLVPYNKQFKLKK